MHRADGAQTAEDEETETPAGGCLQRLRERSDAGYILVMTGMLILPLLAFTALAVDLGSWYAQASRMQRTADAAALAGVVWVAGGSGSCPNGYVCVAQSTAQRNGYTNGVNSAKVDVAKVNDSQLQVTVSAPATLFFGQVFLKSQTLKRTAIAEYVTPIPMGSPTSNLGNDPDQLALGYNPHYWLNIAGWASPKTNGDQYTASNCGVGMYGCNGSGTGQNSDYSTSGYTYYVSNTGGGSGNLSIDVYDPGFVQQGDQCSVHLSTGNLTNAVALWGGPTGRYDGTNLDYCPGDTNLGNTDLAAAKQVQTTYIVRAPDATPLDNTDNPILCAMTFSGYNALDETALNNLLSAAAPVQGTEQEKVGTWYHRWYPVCKIANGYASTHPGNYIVQMKTNADVTTPVKFGGPSFVSSGTPVSAGSLNGTESTVTFPRIGHNRYAMRSGWSGSSVGSSAWGQNLSTYAAGHLPIYVNVSTVSGTYKPSFYLARVPTKYSGKILQLDFWDLGDVGGSPGTVDFTLTGSADIVNLPNVCAFKRDGVPYGSGQWGTTISGCSIFGVNSANFNGHLNTATITLPDAYACNDSDAKGCWISVNLTYKGVPTDTTTWSARILGDPVHLVQ
jgi:hypothetical protein